MKVHICKDDNFDGVFKHPTGFFICVGAYFEICSKKIKMIDKKSIVLSENNKNYVCVKSVIGVFYSLFCDANYIKE